MKNIDQARQPAVLVTGGAGYIGSHTTLALAAEGFCVIILDNFSQHQTVNLPWAEVIRGDFADEQLLRKIFNSYLIEAVFHFAAFIEVGESVKRPRDFYENNVLKTAVLLRVMQECGVLRFIFSSSCAVYGTPQYVPMDEQHPTAPVSPYGRTKLAVEFMLQDYAQAYGLAYASLRYFNAAGAQWEKGLGEYHTPETHLIPLLLRAIEQNQPVFIFGDNYETVDGTCIRDYVHVQDLAVAHVLAFKRLLTKAEALIINVGTGRGYSVREVVKVTEEVCGKEARIEIMPRRQGDAAVLVSNTSRMKSVLSWHPQHSDLFSIVASVHALQQHKMGQKGALPLTL